VLLLTLICGGAGGALALVLRSHRVAVASGDRDPGVIELPGDAAIAELPLDGTAPPFGGAAGRAPPTVDSPVFIARASDA
jgi:hypothetical protein